MLLKPPGWNGPTPTTLEGSCRQWHQEATPMSNSVASNAGPRNLFSVQPVKPGSISLPPLAQLLAKVAQASFQLKAKAIGTVIRGSGSSRNVTKFDNWLRNQKALRGHVGFIGA